MNQRPASRIVTVVTFLAILLAASSLVYGAVWWFDQGGIRSPLELVLSAEAADRMGSFAEVVVAVLGVAITVVAILVELAANRYTPRITDLFVRDPVNVVVLAFFVVSSVLVVWLDVSGWPPEATTMRLVALALISASLLALLPYFAYVFDFLTPTRVIRTLQRRAERAVTQAATSRKNNSALRIEVLLQLDQLGDMALHAVDNNDKAIAVAAVNAIADILEVYLPLKNRMGAEWFPVGTLIRQDQDFVAMHPDILDVIGARGTWVEMKGLRQLEAVFSDALNDARDVNHLIGIRVRRLMTLTNGTSDEPARTLLLRFVYTYLRASINARDVRTTYNLYNELRLIAEGLMDESSADRLVEVAQRMKFYGQLAFHKDLPFILETAAYDLCSLLVRASRLEHPRHDDLLSVFLDVDREPDSANQEAALRGVRKAQAKLATHYLFTQDKGRARRIQEDMRGEPAERLQSIRMELLSIQDPEFWEVSDRGINFDYIPLERREHLNAFFAWFGQKAS